MSGAFTEDPRLPELTEEDRERIAEVDRQFLEWQQRRYDERAERARDEADDD